jgi:hypothetical protein
MSPYSQKTEHKRMTTYHFTPESRNAKTGRIPTTTTSENTCPPSCAMFDTCYAKGGPQAMHWRKVSDGKRGGTITELCDKIRALPEGQIWRHNVSGDLPGIGEFIKGLDLRRITDANRGKRGFTYTHKRPHVGNNAAHIAEANANGFTVNLSSNSLAEADEFLALGIAPVVTILPIDATENTTTPNGARVVVCPATQRDDVTCETCKMCAVRDRSTVIGFPVHGSRKRQANNELTEREQS